MPKMRMGTPAQPQVHTKRYSSFKGVDFSSDATQVDDSRSPRAVNLITDETGLLQKRAGWRKLTSVEAPVRGIYRFKVTAKKKDDETIQTVDTFIVHAGGKLYSWAGDETPPEVLMGETTETALKGETSSGYMKDDNLYILTGAEFIVVQWEKASGNYKITANHLGASENAYVPLTRRDMTAYYGTPMEKRFSSQGVEDYFPYIPDVTGTTEGCESINILTNLRKNSFNFSREKIGDEESVIVLRLEGKLPIGTKIEDIKLTTEQGNSIQGGDRGYVSTVNYVDSYRDVFYFTTFSTVKTGGVEAIKDSIDKSKSVAELPENGSQVFLRIDGLTFRNWLDNKKNSLGVGKKADTSTTFTLEYPAEPIESQKDTYERASKCTTFGFYNDRVFITGNPDYPNADFYFNIGSQPYLPDLNYTEIGNDDSRIMGYLSVGKNQVVLKSDSLQLQDASVYLRRSEWDNEQGYYFPLERGIVGAGAVSPKAIATFVDDPLYLSKTGVMGIITENITGERLLVQKSTRINSRLLKEQNLEKAVMTVWNGYLLIAVNNRVYVADSRQRTYTRNQTGTFEYEWYYWENIPAVCFKEVDGELFFGTSDGRLCKFNTDVDEASGIQRFSDYPDGVGVGKQAKAIIAEWSTKMDDDGCFTLQKNLCRRGCGIFLKGVKSGKVKIWVRTDKEFDEDLELVDKDLSARSWSQFNFETLSFENLSFKTKTCMVAAPNKKVKKYAALQIICRSDEATDFALMGIEKRYTVGRYEK